MWLWCMVAVLPCGHSPGGSGGLPHGITENAFNVRGMVLRLLAEIGEKNHPGTSDPCEPSVTATSCILRKAGELEEFLVVACGQLFWPDWCSSESLQTGFLYAPLYLLIAARHWWAVALQHTSGLGPGMPLVCIFAFPPCSIHLHSSIDLEPNGSPGRSLQR